MEGAEHSPLAEFRAAGWGLGDPGLCVAWAGRVLLAMIIVAQWGSQGLVGAGARGICRFGGSVAGSRRIQGFDKV